MIWNCHFCIIFQQTSTVEQAVTDLTKIMQKFGTKVHQNAFGRRALPCPDLETERSPDLLAAGWPQLLGG